jgi:hypothetical protein
LNVYRIRGTRCGLGNGLVMREPTVHERQDRIGRDKMRWDDLGGGGDGRRGGRIESNPVNRVEQSAKQGKKKDPGIGVPLPLRNQHQ